MAKKPATVKSAKKRKYVRRPDEKQARGERLAAAVASGVAVAEVARQEGLSRSHTSTLVNSAPVKHIITDLVNNRMGVVEELFDLGLMAIREALTNGNTYAVEKHKDAEGELHVEPVLVGPDHYARMQAMKVLNTICCTGRAAVKPVDPRELVPKMTYEDLVRIIAERKRYEADMAPAQVAA